MNTRFTAIAAAALATAAIFASPAAYAAESADTVNAVVRYDDLDLASRSGQHALARRVNAAARTVCGSGQVTGSHIDPSLECRSKLTAQINQQVRQQTVTHTAFGG